jgi:DNA topoisomerase-2
VSLQLFDEFWPGLIRQEDPIRNGQGDSSFLWEFITPIIKVTKGVSVSGVAGLNSQEVCFYSLPQFNEWLNNNNQGKGWNIKYYKSEQLTRSV